MTPSGGKRGCGCGRGRGNGCGGGCGQWLLFEWGPSGAILPALFQTAPAAPEPPRPVSVNPLASTRASRGGIKRASNLLERPSPLPRRISSDHITDCALMQTPLNRETGTGRAG
eukprot:9491674-Pyramimonas_sp.AAC.1